MNPLTTLFITAAITAIAGASGAEPKSYSDLKKEEMVSHQSMMGDHEMHHHGMKMHGHMMHGHMMHHRMMKHRHHMKH